MSRARSPPGHLLSVVAEIEETSPQATPTSDKWVEPIQREESIQSVEWPEDEGDTAPLI